MIVGEVVRWVRDQGADPFIVPAMGSHGGATAERQRRVLANYGITEASTGAAIVSSMEVVELGRGDLPIPLYMDRHACAAAGILIINRVKPHTSFHGTYESGLLKMIAIGLGKQAQASAIHQLGVQGLREMMPRAAQRILQQTRILLGLAVVENACDEPMLIRAIPAARIVDEEPVLLEVARRNLPSLPLDVFDLLIVDEIGKDISGLGMDTNVIGRLRIPGQPEPDRPRIRTIVVRGLSESARGNALGVGLADVCTRRLFEQIDFAAMYENALTSTFLERAKIPVIAGTDAEAMQFALRSLGLREPGDLRVIRIRNTLKLEMMQVSTPVWEAIRHRPGIEYVGEIASLIDEHGQMVPPAQ